MPKRPADRWAPAKRLKPLDPRPIKGVKPGEPEPANLLVYLGDNLLAIRKARNMTLREMSVETGFRPTRLSTFERAQKAINMDTLARLAAAYRVDASSLLADPKDRSRQVGTIPLDALQKLTESIHEKVTELLEQHGPVSVEHAQLASVLGAMFDAIASFGKYDATSMTGPKKPVIDDDK